MLAGLLANPGGSVGLNFLVPGVDEVMRASGRATMSKEPKLLAGMAVGGKLPKLAIVVALDEVFFHCGKALKRAGLWGPAREIDRTDFPSYAVIVGDEFLDLLDRLVRPPLVNDLRNELY